MDKVLDNFATLKKLSCCSKKVKNQVIKKGKKDLIHTICECVHNTLNGKVKLTPKELNKLNNHKYTLRKLLSKKNLKDKKEILIQKGGFLNILLPSAIALLTSILEKKK